MFKSSLLAAIVGTVPALLSGEYQSSEVLAMKSATVTAPGAKIYYEVRGSGPTLLLISGGPLDAGIYANLAQRLSDRYTVVTYDPRGNSRSTFDVAPVDTPMDVHGDDAARLIETLGGGPAYVFGSSGGAQIGLNLAARYPKLVRTLVAHEPPCIPMQADSLKDEANLREVYATYRRDGIGAATEKFMTQNGLVNQAKQPKQPAPAAPDQAAAEMMQRMQKNFDFFFSHSLMTLALYSPDVKTLLANRTRVVIGVGADSAGQTANRTGLALAAKLGIAPVVFAGDHNGYVRHAESFAAILQRVLQ